MVDEQEPTKRVVKRVVKKTVARPPKVAQAAPNVRYGRPVATATKTKSPVVPQAKAQPRPSAKTAAPRQRIDLRSKAGGARQRGVDTWWIVADGVGSGARTAGRFVGSRARIVSGWRLPHLNPYLAAAVTGAVVGIASVVLGIVALAIFQQTRGVSSGGGLWGGLTFTGIAIAAVFLGEALLHGFGATTGRLTSALAVVLTIVAILGLFLELADSWAAALLVPVLGIIAFTLSRWLMDVAESAPTHID